MRLLKSNEYRYMFRIDTKPDGTFWPGHDHWHGYFKHTYSWFNSYMHHNDQIGYYTYLKHTSFYI